MQNQDLTQNQLRRFYRYMLSAREVDRLEDQFTKRGEAFFHVSGAGHEGSVVLEDILGEQDWLHCHYRDKALMLARGVSNEMFFHSLFCKDASHSRGRQMSAHISDPEHKVLSLAGPVGNNALPAAGIAAEVKTQEGSPVVLCALGDGMTQEGEVLESIAHSVRERLPVLYFVEDNVYAISTQTRGQTFFSTPDGEAESFYGIPIVRIDGCNIVESHSALSRVVTEMRETRNPAIVIFQVDRISNHTNADDQSVYRSAEDIGRSASTRDPLVHCRNLLLESGMNEDEIKSLEEEVKSDVHEAADRSRRSPEPDSVFDAKRPLSPAYLKTEEYRGSYEGPSPDGEKQSMTMIEAIRESFRIRLENDKRLSLFGEDIEDPKGDVFGITKGLSTANPGRVLNSPLSESTIAGVSVGRALAGGRPVGFIQFADFLPLAYNQIFSEMGSMYWRTDGGWDAPAILMITSGGYKPGLGPFHASSLEAMAVHTPGVDVVMPSSAGDAAGLLNSAYESGRPTLFFYPKNCLNDRNRATSPDIGKHFVPVGKARRVRSGSDISLIGWGNTVSLMNKAAAALEEKGVEVDLIDLRSLSPWDKDMVRESVGKSRRVIIAHEDNRSSGFGAEILAYLSEELSGGFSSRRVVREDTYVPCNFGNQLEVLPSYKEILEAAVQMLQGDMEWDKPLSAGEGEFLVEAIGSSPSDEMVTVIEYLVKAGEEVKEGELVASVEADKAVTEIAAPISGTVRDLLVEIGDEVAVGTPLIRLLTEDAAVPKPPTREEPGTPVIRLEPLQFRSSEISDHVETPDSASPILVGIAGVAHSAGSRILDNEEISRLCPSWSPEDIVKRTGIQRRRWAGDDQSAVGMAVEAATELMNRFNLEAGDLGGIYLSTGTPDTITPSLACRVLDRLPGCDPGTEIPAMDFSAACSGYIYGLQIAHDALVSTGGGKPILLITTELLSRRLDSSDPSTAPIFGDAATATLISAAPRGEAGETDHILPIYRIHRPSLFASPDTEQALTVPLHEQRGSEGETEYISMEGPVIYQKAVRAMISSLDTAAKASGFKANNLDLIVPHQANQRIINAVRQRMKLDSSRVFSMIKDWGNTSSSTIPLCIEQILNDADELGQIGAATASSGSLPSTLGLTAFGGGFTYAGAVLERV